MRSNRDMASDRKEIERKLERERETGKIMQRWKHMVEIPSAYFMRNCFRDGELACDCCLFTLTYRSIIHKSENAE